MQINKHNTRIPQTNWGGGVNEEVKMDLYSTVFTYVLQACREGVKWASSLGESSRAVLCHHGWRKPPLCCTSTSLENVQGTLSSAEVNGCPGSQWRCILLGNSQAGYHGNCHLLLIPNTWYSDIYLFNLNLEGNLLVIRVIGWFCLHCIQFVLIVRL